MKIIIIGANSVISKSLISECVKHDDLHLFLYTTNEEKCKNFVNSLDASLKISVSSDYSSIENGADIIINCVGVGTPKELNNNYTPWFTVLEEFDNKCIEYIKNNNNCTYISLSSGVVYGEIFDKPANAETKNQIDINKMGINNFYSISKLYSEAKHRSFSDLNIVDLRIFSFFSRYSKIDDGYFMSDLVSSIKNKKTLITKKTDIVRDYVSPSDLLDLIISCGNHKPLNSAIDVISKKTISKFEILEFARKMYSLEYEFSDDINCINSSGQKNSYYSVNNTYDKLNFSPKYTSEETLINEMNCILLNQNNK